MNSDDLPTQIHSLRRSATLPPKLSSPKQRSLNSLDPSDEILFYHPSAKIVHFSPRAIVRIPSSSAPSDFDYPVDTIETLPWRSATERTVALAPLKLEKVQGLTVFLKCGSVVHAILKNSQCWCVDGESTFVLRIRPLTYYRIELPLKTDDDAKYVVELKTALPGILRYEITPCPFKRGFTVELPEEAVIPKRKRAWRPRERRESAPVYPSFMPERKDEQKEDSERPSTGDDSKRNASGTFTPRPGSSSLLETIPDDIESSAPMDIPKYSVKPATSAPRENFNTLLARFEASTEPDVNPDPSLLSSSAESFHSSLSISSPPTSSAYSSSSIYPNSLECVEEVQEAPESCPGAYPLETIVSKGSMEHCEDDHESPTCQDLPKAATVDQDSRSLPALESIDESQDAQHCSEDAPETTVFKDSTLPAEIELSDEPEGDRNSTGLQNSPNPAISEQELPKPREDDRESPVTHTRPNPSTIEQKSGPQATVPSGPETSYPTHTSLATGSGSDMSNMTLEFRRRARKTRMRDLSPMPPASTLHQPSPNRSAKQVTTSFFHKTCSLVLVPPVQLFLVLIHIAAQIVIKPDRSAQHLENEDDFGVPITHDAPSDGARRYRD